MDNHYTKMTNRKIVRQELTNHIKKNKKYLGLEIYYKEEQEIVSSSSDGR